MCCVALVISWHGLQGQHEAANAEGPPDTGAQVPAAGTPGVQTNGMAPTNGLAGSAPVTAEPAQASVTVDAGEGPAAKRAKHADMAESEATTAPVTLPTPTSTSTPAPAAAEPSDAQGGSLWTPSYLPNTFSMTCISAKIDEKLN